MATLITQHPAPETTFDVAVIGAGINGLAIAREAALRGLSVALFDKDDLGARSSAISTRLIHGGLKYLERLDFRLVFESIRERSTLLKQAPHLVQRYPMLIPFYRTASRPGWLLACGLVLHDVLAIGKPLPFNRIVFRRQLRKGWPGLEQRGLGWGGIFEDAQVPWTERVCVELAVSASDHGAVVFTHTAVVAISTAGQQVTGVTYRAAADGVDRTLRARAVINAAGPWVDDVLAGQTPGGPLVGPTKGSHLVVDAFPGAPESCIFFEARADARPMFVLPWAGRYMLGTTDIPFEEGLESITASDAEVEYLLAETNHLIPSAGLTAEDVLWSYSGVRPLPFVPNLANPAKVTRDHKIIAHDGGQRGLYSVIGGKFTTHRALGEQTVDLLVSALGKGARKSQTHHARYPGAPSVPWAEYVEAFVAGSALPAAVARRLVSIYGTRGQLIEKLVSATPSLGEVIDVDSGAIAAEVVFALQQEGAQTLEDVLLRRILVGLNGDVGLGAAPRAAEIAVAHAGWSAAHAEAQVSAYVAATARFRPQGPAALPAQVLQGSPV